MLHSLKKIKKQIFLHLIHLNPRIKILFQNFGRVTVFILLTPNFMQILQRSDINDKLQNFDGRTDRQTYEPNYIKPTFSWAGQKV